jgi:argininosuccinate synthase
MTRIVLGYSGGLATTVAIPWLATTCRAEVVAVTIDLGDGQELEAIRDRALAAGAVRAHVLDVRDVFAREYVVPALRAGALSDASMLSALASPLVAKTLLEIAGIEQATGVAHGAAGSGEARLACTFAALGPSMAVFAPARDWSMTPGAQVEYARAHNVLWTDAPAAAPHQCPDEPAYVDVRIERGIPSAINHIEMPFGDLVSTLATIATAHGVGSPPAVMLHAAHAELQRVTASPDVDRVAAIVCQEYAALITAGQWFAPLRRALDAFVAAAQEEVTGVVSMKLYKGVLETTAVPQAARPKTLPLVAVR